MKNTICILVVFLFFFLGCSTRSEVHQTVTIKNPIADHNRYVGSMLEKKTTPHMTLKGIAVPIRDVEGSIKYLEEKTLTIFDEQLRKEILSNLFINESLFQVDEGGLVSASFCVCIPDVTIRITDLLNDSKQYQIFYFKFGEV